MPYPRSSRRMVKWPITDVLEMFHEQGVDQPSAHNEEAPATFSVRGQ